jgi:PilZ domain
VAGASEKRKTPRIRPWVAPCVVVDGARRLPAYFTDLSVRGARLSTEAPPPAAHARVIVEARLGRAVAPSRLPGLVKWAKALEKGHEFGITFVGITSELQRSLEAVVADFRRLADTLS